MTNRTKSKSVLFEAIKDLEYQINNLSKERGELKKSLNKVSSAINIDRKLEKQLQHKIANLVEKEAELNQQKKNLQTKIEKISDSLSKISKIKSEMADV